MQREDVTAQEADWRRWKRGEELEALAKERGITRERMRHRLARMDVNMTQLALLDRAEKAEAELDAAFAAGWKAAIEEAQSILRESWDDLSGHAAAGLIDALTIKPRP